MATADAYRRREQRMKALLAARLSFASGASSFDCIIRDLSPSGARLAVTAGMPLPERFQLLIPSRSVEVQANVAWIRGENVGVWFTKPAPSKPATAEADTAPSAEQTEILAKIEALEARLARVERILRETGGEVLELD